MSTIDGKKYKCPHDPFSTENKKRTKWIKPGFVAHLEIRKIVGKGRLLKDLEHCAKACYTAELEAFHSLCTKYCEKCEGFEYEVMDARMKCAVMNHNENNQRKAQQIRERLGSNVLSQRRQRIGMQNQF